MFCKTAKFQVVATNCFVASAIIIIFLILGIEETPPSSFSYPISSTPHFEASGLSSPQEGLDFEEITP